jgi:hypothetical protein
VRIAVNSLPRGREVYGPAVRKDCEHTFVSYEHTGSAVNVVSRLLGTGISDHEIGRRTGVSRSSVQRWRTRGVPRGNRGDRGAWRPFDPVSYSYLLGIYLGDGYLARSSPQSAVLEISLDPKYPGIVDECSTAIWKIAGTRVRISRRRTQKGEGIRLAATSTRWPIVFPQHGPGKKHQRAIRLASWQKAIVNRFPEQFLRGLIHSDGSRVLNRFKAHLASGQCEYVYPRYFFTNLSEDIRGLFCASCEQLGIRWTQSSYKNISVADRQSVALLDGFIGPKK